MQLSFLLLMQNLVKDTLMETSQSQTKAFKVSRGAYSKERERETKIYFHYAVP